MVLNKALLIKVLTGLTTIAVTATPLALNWEKITNSSNNKPVPSTDPSSQNQNTQDTKGQVVDAESLITNSGLNCTFSNGSNEGECTSVATNKTINVKHENNTKNEGITSISVTGSAKIKIQKGATEGSYNGKVKLTIEGGDITLTGGSGSQTISKLEQFETYEITEEGTGEEKKYYLTRKEKAADEIRRTLGLPESCSFPDSNTSNGSCTINSDDINGINFLGKSGTVTNSSSSTLELTITKVSDTTNYPLGYKFSFKTTGSGNITVSTTTPNTPITFRPNSPIDFKIKKEGNNGKDLKLEKDLTLNTLLSEVGLSGCTTTTGSNECNISTDGLNVKQDSNKEEGRTKDTSSSSGKIKVYSETTYSNSFKFVIEEGDISFNNTDGKQITKLEQFETYEIKKESDNKWYLSRKDKAEEGKKKALGLGGITNCSLPTTDNQSQTCSNITAEQIKAINFEGKTENGVTVNSGGTATLTITKVSNSDSDFPNGYKLSLQPTQQVTITKTSGNITLKANEKTEFKIKKSGNTLSLEKAWTLNKLLEKVGLSGCTATENNNNECSIGNSGLNVKQGESNKKTGSTGSSGGKIKLYTGDAEGYEYGFKFVIEDGDITLTGGTGSGTISKLEQFETYEIKKEDTGTDWYLTRKKDALEEKKRILGLPADDESCKLPTSEAPSVCCNLDATKLKAINFDGKGTDEPTIENSGTVALTITKETTDTDIFTEGYKFSFQPTQDVTISTSSSIKIMKNTNTEFKIKKSGNTLTLEKAWTVEALAKKAGLTGCDTSAKTCDLPTSEALKLYNDSGDKTESGKVADNSKKLKYEENVAGHNQGFKFYTEQDITLEGDNNNGKKIEKKEENNNGTTYEIKQQSDNKWYLSKVTPAVAA